MEIIGYLKGYATKTVHIKGADEHTDFDIAALAMLHAGETRGSLFGYTVRWADDMSGPEVFRVAIVSLHTD